MEARLNISLDTKPRIELNSGNFNETSDISSRCLRINYDNSHMGVLQTHMRCARVTVVNESPAEMKSEIQVSSVSRLGFDSREKLLIRREASKPTQDPGC